MDPARQGDVIGGRNVRAVTQVVRVAWVTESGTTEDTEATEGGLSSVRGARDG
jgi:hypothetical protein